MANGVDPRFSVESEPAIEDVGNARQMVQMLIEEFQDPAVTIGGTVVVDFRELVSRLEAVDKRLLKATVKLKKGGR